MADPIPDPRRWLIALVVGAALLLLGGLGWTARALRTLAEVEATNAGLRTELAALQGLVVDVGAYEALQVELEQRIEAVAALRTQTTWLPSVLLAVEAAVPGGVWLTRLELHERRLDLHGETEDPGGVATLMEGLQDSPCFEQVALRSVEGRPAAQAFWLRAEVGAERCFDGTPGGRDLFLSPALVEELRPKAQVHPLRRWGPRAYDLVALQPGRSATLRDPERGLHLVGIGHGVGDGSAVVTFITDDSIVLTEDHLTDPDTKRTETSIITITLVDPG